MSAPSARLKQGSRGPGDRRRRRDAPPVPRRDDVSVVLGLSCRPAGAACGWAPHWPRSPCWPAAGLLGLSGWFITATALAGAQAATAIVFDVFMPSAGIRLLALGRTLSRYGERLVTHDATLEVLAGLRERLFRGWARPGAARALAMRPARLLFRLTSDIDALESLNLRLLVPAGAACGAALFAALVLGLMRPVDGAGAGGLAARGRLAAWPGRRRGARARPRCGGRSRWRRCAARAIDLVAGQTELAMAGRLDAQCQALAAADRRLAHAELRLNRLEATRRRRLRRGRRADAGGGAAGRGGAGRDRGRSACRRPRWACWWRWRRWNPLPRFAAAPSKPGRSALAARRVAPRLAWTPASPVRSLPQARADAPAAAGLRGATALQLDGTSRHALGDARCSRGNAAHRARRAGGAGRTPAAPASRHCWRWRPASCAPAHRHGPARAAAAG